MVNCPVKQSIVIIAMHYKDLRNWLTWPHHCLLCDEQHYQQAEICGQCRNDLPWLKHTCQQCSIPVVDDEVGQNICGQCLQHPPAYDLAYAAFAYICPIIQLISSFKYHRRINHGISLSLLLIQYLLSVS